jgi:hypothetical protein
MRSYRAALAALAVTIAACQLELGGEAFVAGHGASDGAGATADAALSDVTGFAEPDESSAGDDAGVPALVGRGSVGAGADAAPPTGRDAGGDADGASSVAALEAGAIADADAGVDAGTQCSRLVQCCPRLLAPPLAIACIASAMQDAGEAACGATMASLVDAGICP